MASNEAPREVWIEKSEALWLTPGAGVIVRAKPRESDDVRYVRADLVPSVPPVGERERRIAETIKDYLHCYDEADRCFGCDNDAGREHAEDCTEAPRIKEARAWADSILSSPAPDPASEPRAKPGQRTGFKRRSAPQRRT